MSFSQWRDPNGLIGGAANRAPAAAGLFALENGGLALKKLRTRASLTAHPSCCLSSDGLAL
jgi:hypothetical protein